MKALIARKVGMTSAVSEDGVLQAITLLSASPNVISQVKDAEKDGYSAVQVGFEEAKKQNVAKAQQGHFAKIKGMLPKIVREFRVGELTEDLAVGEKVNAEVFSVGDTVQVSATSKGKGWAGTIKRHNFHRQRQTHGAKGNTRAPGSIGSMFPQKIFKGKKMAGRMGGGQVTVKNLKVALIDTENNIIGISGAVPGPSKGIVVIKGATR